MQKLVTQLAHQTVYHPSYTVAPVAYSSIVASVASGSIVASVASGSIVASVASVSSHTLHQICQREDSVRTHIF